MAKISEITVEVHADTTDVRKQLNILKREIWWMKHGRKIGFFALGYMVADIFFDLLGFFAGW